MPQLNIFVLLLFFAVALALLLMSHTIIKRNSERSFFLLFLSVCTFLYSFGYLLEVTSPTLEAAFVSVRVQYMALPLILPFAYLFLRDVYGKGRLPVLAHLLIFLVPVTNMAALQAFPHVKLFYREIHYIFNGYIANCLREPGPLYHLGTFYHYLFFFLSLRLIIHNLRVPGKLRRRQNLLVLGAFLFPLLFSIPYTLNIDLALYDPIPFALVVTLAMLLYAVEYEDILSVVPLARAQVIEAMEDAFVVCDSRYHFLDANPAAKELFPALGTLLRGESMTKVEGFQSEGLLSRQVGDALRVYKASHSRILQYGKSRGVCVVFHDITEEERLLQRLQLQATMDPLMNIYNRGTFFDLAGPMLDSVAGRDYPHTLLMLDLDYFKQVNDTRGHLCGDSVLEKLAQVVKKQVRQEDLIGRYGGEEIVVLLRNISIEHSIMVADKLRTAIQETNFFGEEDTPLPITVSIGASHSPRGVQLSLESMLAKADQALYTAKNSGRNRTCFYNSEEQT